MPLVSWCGAFALGLSEILAVERSPKLGILILEAHDPADTGQVDAVGLEVSDPPHSVDVFLAVATSPPVRARGNDETLALIQPQRRRRQVE